jgi:hypothetical protein
LSIDGTGRVHLCGMLARLISITEQHQCRVDTTDCPCDCHDRECDCDTQRAQRRDV